MRRFAIAVLVLAACDGSPAAADEEESSSSSTDPSAGETFSEGGSSSGGGEEAPEPGEEFGFCESDEDCVAVELGEDARGVVCAASTCVQQYGVGFFSAWLAGDIESPCPPESTPIGSTGADQTMVCGYVAQVVDGLGHCPEGMHVVTWQNETRDTITCWWSDALLSGGRCSGECECVDQPVSPSSLPAVCV